MITVNATLPAEARKLREDVFIHEQGFENEFDEIDQSAHHVIYWESDRAVGTCRFFPAEEDGAYYIGRMAVAKDHRHQKTGRQKNYAFRASARPKLLFAQRLYRRPRRSSYGRRGTASLAV